MTEWKYDWRDRITNILHTLSNSTVSFGYIRAAGGEPSRITREDGSYVDLKYDAALRLTNEIYYSNSVAIATNSYGYDAAGNRVRFGNGVTTVTNAVSAGYRITSVQNAANGNTVQSYGYDAGGRVTSITRNNATRNLGYNTADQLTAFTNVTAGSWVTYSHDASGRRTDSTNSANAVRRFVVAGTPGTDLESPLVIADAGGNMQQGYVYLGREPLLRYDALGNAVFYLDDAMGSIAALADNAGVKTAIFNYDAFGNVRGLSGGTNAPSGTEGDFRFQGAWWEAGSDLYNMRAREYDQRVGRFVSRDPIKGASRAPETLQPYSFAADNPEVYSDPSGQFTVIEISAVDAMDKGLETFKNIAINRAKQYAKDKIVESFSSVAIRSLEHLFPNIASFRALFLDGAFQAGVHYENQMTAAVCSKLPAAVRDVLWLGPAVASDGTPVQNGFGCGLVDHVHHGGTGRSGEARPDFILSRTPPTQTVHGDKAYLIGDFKLSGNSLYTQYVDPRTKKTQFRAIGNYTRKHTEMNIAIFITIQTGAQQNLRRVSTMMAREGLKDGVLFFVFAVHKNRNF